MQQLTYTLVTDGSSDRVLQQILTWLLHEHLSTRAIEGIWADLSAIRFPSKPGLANKIKTALLAYPCDLLFIHRDAENELPVNRVKEIEDAITYLIDSGHQVPPSICVIPIRMQEAWLLFDKEAIFRAVGNPNEKRKTIQLPQINALENIPDPKRMLHEFLREASGLHGRRKKEFNPRQTVYRLVEAIDDFTPLRYLSAFQALEQDIQEMIEAQNWNTE
mgnify:CR=1 FL=1